MEEGMSQAHLSELFRTGKIVALEVADPDDDSSTIKVDVWMRKPHPSQQDEAMEKARAKQARRLRELRDPESDFHLAMTLEVAEMDHDLLVDQLCRFRETKLRQQAHNEVMFSEEFGSDWGTSGHKYLDLVAAVSQRMQEVADKNKSLPEGSPERIRFDDDKELVKLQEEQFVFEQEVRDRTDQLMLEHRKTLSPKTDEDLRLELIKINQETEASLIWYQEYRTNLLFYAIRYPDDRKKLYFNTPYDILELPIRITNILFDEYDQLDRGTDLLKNLPSPLPS
jgi:hypothetical protein